MNAILLGETFGASEENALEFKESKTGKEMLIPKPLNTLLRVIEFDILLI